MASAIAHDDILSLSEDLVKKTKTFGADHAEVVIIKTTDTGIDVRNGEIENSDYSDAMGVGVRVLIGQKSATVSGSDLSPQALSSLAERAVSIAKFVPDDEFSAIAPEDMLEKNPNYDLGCYDDAFPSLDTLREYAFETEKVALSYDGITNSEGAGCSFGSYALGLVASNGFSGLYQKTLFGLSCCVLAGEGTEMERDYDYTTTPFFSKLKKPDVIGRNAAEKTLKRLHPKRMRSGEVPIIFDTRSGRSLLGYFAGAISADRVARKTSFLGNAVGEKVFADSIHIIDDPHLKSGLGSCPFDLEGVRNPKLDIVTDGTLNHLFSHGASSRQLNITNNGRATRSVSAVPYPASTNLYMQNGTMTPAALMKDIDYGLYVMDTIGHGINEITGDYSIGAAGFLIENGEISYPVSEITIAGNLKNMFLNMQAANDLKFESRKNVPTLRVDGMTVAGE
ncbi:MAG: metallopeptidase TldD-related protein [Pseudomonadota bacterium]